MWQDLNYNEEDFRDHLVKFLISQKGKQKSRVVSDLPTVAHEEVCKNRFTP